MLRTAGFFFAPSAFIPFSQYGPNPPRAATANNFKRVQWRAPNGITKAVYLRAMPFKGGCRRIWASKKAATARGLQKPLDVHDTAIGIPKDSKGFQ